MDLGHYITRRDLLIKRGKYVAGTEESIHLWKDNCFPGLFESYQIGQNADLLVSELINVTNKQWDATSSKLPSFPNLLCKSCKYL